jgi:hypothetical protein
VLAAGLVDHKTIPVIGCTEEISDRSETGFSSSAA